MARADVRCEIIHARTYEDDDVVWKVLGSEGYGDPIGPCA